jgi:hypothetical protein
MQKGKVKEMREQEMLRAEQQLAYKHGDMDKVKSIEARLAPELDTTIWK